MTVKGGTTPACAACKYQRRKCTPNCPLAPYFPADQPKMFRNVHRLFGVSNITKTLSTLETKDQKEDAMKSIIYEAEMRDRFPVYGCSMIICQLRFQLQCALEELRYVYSQLAACKEQQSNKQLDQNSSCYWPSTQIEFDHMPQVGANAVHQFNQYLLNENNGFCADIVSNNNFFTPLVQMNEFGIQQEREMFTQDYEGLHFNATPDDRQSYIETKEACESSSESSMRDTTHCMEKFVG